MAGSGREAARAKKGKRDRCPQCGKASVPGFRPFCSARCASLDLGRWLKGSYRIETEEEPRPGETPPEEEG